MNFSFAGCGFLGIYHVGVAACLKKYAPNLLLTKISGASAGALAAVVLLCDGPLGLITSSVLKTATEARKLFLGPFSPAFDIERLLRDGLLGMLPEDAHLRVNGKLFISVTRVCDGKNVLLSHFDTREELIQALLCSAFIPGFSGWRAPTVRGVRYVDGGFSDNLPQLDVNTVIVSPFCGEADICPKDVSAALVTICLANTSIELSRENLYRFSLILFPPPPEILNRMCQQGFNDALEFLQRNQLISCTRCLAVHSTFNLEDNRLKEEDELAVGLEGEMDEDHLHCEDCQVQRQEAILDTLPEAVGSVLQHAIDSANSGLVDWVFRNRSLRMISFLTLPYIIPVEVVYATYIKLSRSAPSLSEACSVILQLISVLKALVRTWLLRTAHVPAPHHHRPRRHHNKDFSCQLSITEFTSEGDVQRITAAENQEFNFSLGVSNDVDVTSHKDALMLEEEALNHLALRCAAKSISRRGSIIPSRTTSLNASRTVSRVVSRRPSLEDVTVTPDSLEDEEYDEEQEDAFHHIINVTNQHDALMAYYYMDDNNEMRVTEIFDMCETGTPSGASSRRRCSHDFRLVEGKLKSHLETVQDKRLQEPKMMYGVSSESLNQHSEKDLLISDPEADQL